MQYKSTPAGRPTSWIPFAGTFAKHMTPASGLHQRFLWMAGAAAGEGSAAERRKTFAQDAAAVAGWDFERIIMCHGDIIEGKDKARKAWIDVCARVSGAEHLARSTTADRLVASTSTPRASRRSKSVLDVGLTGHGPLSAPFAATPGEAICNHAPMLDSMLPPSRHSSGRVTFFPLMRYSHPTSAPCASASTRTRT